MEYEFVLNNHENPCHDILIQYINTNYSWGSKIFKIVVDYSTHRTIILSNTPLTDDEKNQIQNLVNVWSCDLNFTDPNTNLTPPVFFDENFLNNFKGPYLFSHNTTNVKNKWLLIDDMTSDKTSYNIPFKGKLAAITFDNKETNLYFKLNIYRNNEKVFTKIINYKKMTIFDIPQNIDFEPNDSLSVFVEKINEQQNPSYPSVCIYFEMNSNFERKNYFQNT